MDGLREVGASNPASSRSAGALAAAALNPEPDPASILAAIGAIVYDWDIATDRLTWGPNVEAVLAGLPSRSFESGSAYAALVTADSDSSRFQAIRNGLAPDAAEGAPFRVGYRLATSAGGCIEVEDNGRWFADPDGRPSRAHGLVRVVSRASARGRAAPSVGGEFAPNPCARRAFSEAVDARCAEARPADAAYAILVVAIAELAAVIRSAGYDAAEELVTAVGRRLARSVRSGDKVARYCGGKFAVFVSLATSGQLEAAAARIARLGGAGAYETSAGVVRARLRVGAALAPRHGRNACLLLQRADEALDKAERADKAFAAFEPNHAYICGRLREAWIADEIVAALNQRRLTLAFRHAVATRCDGPGFEQALLRIRLDDGGLLGPEAVLPIAEKLDLIGLIDHRMLELTLERLSADPSRRLSTSVSVATLRGREGLDGLLAQLANCPGAAQRLIIEIDETQAVENAEDIARALGAVKRLGVKIAIDDFGSARASLRDLDQLGVDMVKIDGAFTQNLARSVEDRFFVRTFASAARRLEIESVAKWVEDGEAAALLHTWGVDYLQGRADAAEHAAPPRRACA